MRTVRNLARAFALLAALAPAARAQAPDTPVAPSAPRSSRLVARSVLPAMTFRGGSPPSGAFLTPAERATAAANGVAGPATGAYFSAQPVQGFSSVVPGAGGTLWALADNGYAWRDNSADWQLVMYRLDPRWGDPRGPALVDTVPLRDPAGHVSWTIACDPGRGTPLPSFAFNALPAPSAACGADPAARLLTGFDFDPESFVLAPDGSFWVSEEFGPFLLHFDADGRLLEPPVAVPGVRSPQNPFLDLSDRRNPERPTVAASRGFEGMAMSPDGGTLFALLEGAVAGDDARDLRIYRYDIAARRFTDAPLKVRLDEPSQPVNLAALLDVRGDRVYPEAVAPPPGPHSIGEIKAVNRHQMLMIERDNLGDDERAPRFKKVFLLDTDGAAGRGGQVAKSLLLDLLAIPDPSGAGGAGDPFSLPFYTIESVQPLDERTLLIASDNNFPGSNGRSRGRSANRRGPLAADATELILVRLDAPLDFDPRLLPGGGRADAEPRGAR